MSYTKSCYYLEELDRDPCQGLVFCTAVRFARARLDAIWLIWQDWEWCDVSACLSNPQRWGRSPWVWLPAGSFNSVCSWMLLSLLVLSVIWRCLCSKYVGVCVQWRVGSVSRNWLHNDLSIVPCCSQQPDHTTVDACFILIAWFSLLVFLFYALSSFHNGYFRPRCAFLFGGLYTLNYLALNLVSFLPIGKG